MAMCGVGLIYEEQDKFEQAEQYYLKAVENGLPVGMCALADLYREQNKAEQAEQYYLMAIENGYSQARINLATMYMDQDKSEQAEHYYAMAANEGDVEAMCDLSYCYFMHGKQPREALALLRQASEMEPAVLSKRLLGLVALWNEEYIEAFTAIDMMLASLVGEEVEMTIFLPMLIMMLAAKGQTAFSLKIFEDERYGHLNLKERLKPYYHAILQEIGESRRDDALRMGTELEQTVVEIRDYIQGFRLQYRLPPTESSDAKAV